MRTIPDRHAWDHVLNEVMLFQSLEADARKMLWETGEVLAFDEAELVIADGDLSPSLFIIVEGTVKVHVDEDGHDVYICSLGVGATFGESSLFLKMPRTANVTALEPAVLLKLTRFDMMNLFRKFPMAGNKFLLVIVYQLMKKLREANRELAYERRGDSDQSEVDALIAELTGQ